MAVTQIPPAQQMYAITGSSNSSRLVELRKFVTTDVFADKYKVFAGAGSDGVDYVNSIEGQKIIYYLGGIRYIDYISNGTTTLTTFKFSTIGSGNPQFITAPIYMQPTKEGLADNPETNNDVFITRQQISAFDGNYRLEHIKNLIELTTYAGGNFFKFVNNQ